MKNKFRFRFGKAAVISGILSSVGYFIINDLKKENSIIRDLIKKVPFYKKVLTKNTNETQIESNNIRVINEIDSDKH